MYKKIQIYRKYKTLEIYVQKLKERQYHPNQFSFLIGKKSDK